MLPVWGAYIWKGLCMEGLIFGILRYTFFVRNKKLPKKIRDLPTLSVFKQHILQLDLNSSLADAQCSNCTLCNA